MIITSGQMGEARTLEVVGEFTVNLGATLKVGQ